MLFRKRTEAKHKPRVGATILTTSLQANIDRFRDDLFVNDGSIVYREFRTQEPHALSCVLIYADNMANHEFLSAYVLRPMMTKFLPAKLGGQGLAEYIAGGIIESDKTQTECLYENLAQAIVSGSAVALVNGCNIGIIIGAQGWEKRSLSEPVSEAVVRGPRIGFTEDLGVGIGLVRRRIKTPALTVKYMEIGAQTKTKVAILSIAGIVNEALVQEVTRRIDQIEIDAIIDSGYIEELIKDSPNSPLPTIGHTERPDIVAAKLLEGRVAVLVDGTPFALTMPCLFMEAFQANEDYFHHWVVASFHRFLRYLCFFLTTSTPALYLALISFHLHLIPTNLVLSIAAARKNVPFPGLVEVVLMGLVFEILREGGLRLPQPVGEAMSIVGAIVLGDAAVSASLVSAPMIIMVAITAISGFVITPLYDSAVLVRLVLVILASLFGLYGVVFGVIGFVLQLASMKSFDVPYLSTLTSFSPQDLKDTALRAPWRFMIFRPRHLAPKNRRRLQNRSRGKEQ